MNADVGEIEELENETIKKLAMVSRGRDYHGSHRHLL